MFWFGQRFYLFIQILFHGPVAQPGRALPLQGRGLGFENKYQTNFGFIEESRRVHFMFINQFDIDATQELNSFGQRVSSQKFPKKFCGKISYL